MRAEGKKVGMFRPISIWPMADLELYELAKKCKRILVVEHNYGQFVLEVERAIHGACDLSFLGVVNGTVITPGMIIDKVTEVEGK